MNEEITITKEEYKELMKCACRLDIAREYVERSKFISPSEIRSILGMEIEEE